jgi:hypothetical protein
VSSRAAQELPRVARRDHHELRVRLWLPRRQEGKVLMADTEPEPSEMTEEDIAECGAIVEEFLSGLLRGYIHNNRDFCRILLDTAEANDPEYCHAVARYEWEVR